MCSSARRLLSKRGPRSRALHADGAEDQVRHAGAVDRISDRDPRGGLVHGAVGQRRRHRERGMHVREECAERGGIAEDKIDAAICESSGGGLIKVTDERADPRVPVEQRLDGGPALIAGGADDSDERGCGGRCDS
jgi:hypothetical protein